MRLHRANGRRSEIARWLGADQLRDIAHCRRWSEMGRCSNASPHKLLSYPIKPTGRLPLRTLAEARGFIRQLPLSEQARVDWISAAALLAEAADRGEPHVSIARAAIERALRRSVTSSSDRR